jgi:hypothetical protein
MKAQWKKGLVEITVWLIAEIILNLLGLDNLADYSEFVFERKVMTISSLFEPAIATTLNF